MEKKNGGFLGLFAKPLLTTLAGVAGPPLLNFATKKYLIEEKGEEEEEDTKKMLPRNNVLLRTLLQPKLVRLPNGPRFYTRYQRVGRHTLYPTKVRIQRTYVRKIRLRQQRRRRSGAQTGSGYLHANTVMRGINLAKPGANSDLGKMVIKDTMDLVPSAYRSIRNRFFRKKRAAATQSTPSYVVDTENFYN